MTALHLGDVADGPVTMRVGGSEPFTFEVLDGSADVPDEFAAFIAAQYGVSAPAPTSTPRGRRNNPSHAPHSDQEPPA